METQLSPKLPFVDALLDNSSPPSLVTSVFRESTLRPSHQLYFWWSFLDHRSTQNQALNPTILRELRYQVSVCPIQEEGLISTKDALSKLSRSRVVPKSSCAGCSVVFPLATRVREHLIIKNWHIFHHINESEQCKLCAQKIASQSPLPRLFNWKARRPYTSGGKTPH